MYFGTGSSMLAIAPSITAAPTRIAVIDLIVDIVLQRSDSRSPSA